MKQTIKYIVDRIGCWLGTPAGWAASKTMNRSGFFFFFPVINIGGAEKVHLDIVSCLKEQQPWVLVSRKTSSDMRPQYQDCGRLVYLESLRRFPGPGIFWGSFWRSFFLAFINHHKNPTVFFWHEDFLRSLIPFLDSKVRLIDIIHNLHPLDNEDDDFLEVKAVERINRRVVINDRIIGILQKVYKRNHLDLNLLDRVVVIPNATFVPRTPVGKSRNGRLRILFVARPSIEKRVHLIGQVAGICKRKAWPCDFTFVGYNIKDMLSSHDAEHCRFLGEIAHEDEIRKVYADHDVIILSSQSEGFPMVFTEAMAHGVVPLSTDVGWIGSHVKPHETGYLVAPFPEERCVREMEEMISYIIDHPAELDRVSKACYEYARDHFRTEIFQSAYKRLLHGTQ